MIETAANDPNASVSSPLRFAGPLFGNYLVDQGTITAQQRDDAIALTLRNHRKLGELAVAHGYIDHAVAQIITLCQLDVDARWGDVAVRLGHLTTEQVDELLAEQRQGGMRIGEALVATGAVPQAELAAHLDAFDRYRAEQCAQLVPERIRTLPVAVDFMGRIALQAGRIALTQLRFLSTFPWYGLEGPEDAVELEIGGPTRLRVALVLSKPTRRWLGQRAQAGCDDADQAGRRAMAHLLDTAAALTVESDPSRTLSPLRFGTAPDRGVAVDIGLADRHGTLVLHASSR